MLMKNPLTPAGIEPATFRFVAQRLNRCATMVPLPKCVEWVNKEGWDVTQPEQEVIANFTERNHLVVVAYQDEWLNFIVTEWWV